MFDHYEDSFIRSIDISHVRVLIRIQFRNEIENSGLIHEGQIRCLCRPQDTYSEDIVIITVRQTEMECAIDRILSHSYPLMYPISVLTKESWNRRLVHVGILRFVLLLRGVIYD